MSLFKTSSKLMLYSLRYVVLDKVKKQKVFSFILFNKYIICSYLTFFGGAKLKPVFSKLLILLWRIVQTLVILSSR